MIRTLDAFGVTGIDKAICADLIAKARVDGLFTPPSEQGTLMVPFTGGGANWGSTAFDSTRNLLVVNMNNLGHLIRLGKPLHWMAHHHRLGLHRI